VEELTSRVTASPQLGAALASGIRSSEALADLDGGTGFIALLAAFLARHGHLGQSADDLSLASWGEAPASLLTEISRRAIHPPEPVLGRVERQGREAAERADTIRAALEDKPADLARFEELLALARDIGGLTETHNYWIDRRAQASMRTLALRAGSRLTEAGVIDDASDVLYLHRDEVAALLDRPADRRSLVAARRVEHERQRRTRPPQTLGRPAADAAGDGAAPGGVAVPTAEERPSADPLLLHGSASSPGVVRGPARVVLTSDDFDRVRAGDIIVCPSSNPSWVIVFMVAGGLVTNTGDVLCHAAVVARELEIPAVTGVGDATSLIDDGTLLELDGTAGTVRILPNGMATAAPES
jgi:phosphohistidine swiveling domain-containing protein